MIPIQIPITTYPGPIAAGVPVSTVFKFINSSHVKTRINHADTTYTDLTYTTQYTVAGAGENSGSVTLVTGTTVATGDTLVIYLDIPLEQTKEYKRVERFPSELTEGILDQIFLALQQQSEQIDRSLLIPLGSGLSNIIFPSPLANAMFGWDSTGTKIENKDPASQEHAHTNLAFLEALAIGDYYLSTAVDTLFSNHATSTDHDGRYYTETEVDSIINTINIYDHVKPQCINRGPVAILGAGSGLQPSLLGNTTTIEGNTQNKNIITVFKINSDISLPTAPANRRSIVVLKNPATADLTQAANVAYSCQRYQRGDSFDITKNALITFDTDLSDKYGNTVTAIGNGAASGGKYVGDGTGDGFKITTITTLGQDKWCIEGKFKFNANNTLYRLIDVLQQFGISLERTTGNKLVLYLSSNGSSNNIADGTGTALGVKADYNTSSEYHIAVEFNGSEYAVYVDGEKDAYKTSSTKIYSSITGLTFGVDGDQASNSLAGTIDNLRVTIGNVRYGATGFTPEASPTPDAYWFDTKNGIMKYGSPASWAELESAVAVGEITTGAATVTDVQTYAYNGKVVLSQAAVTVNNSYSLTHNLGVDNIKLTGEFYKIRGSVYGLIPNSGGYKIGEGHDFENQAGSILLPNPLTAFIVTSNTYLWLFMKTPVNMHFTIADAKIIAEYSEV